MARMARVVVPCEPHHITQRGARRQRTFFRAADYQHYLALLAEACRESKTRIWAYCLMPNHVHLVAVPAHVDGLRASFAWTHQRYASAVNERHEWRGHLWQERYYSFPMDEPHLLAAVRYVERNPVAAGLCPHAADWPWSSAPAHLAGHNDLLVEVEPMLARVEDWSAYLAEPNPAGFSERIAKHSRSGRPLGDDGYVLRLERITGRVLRRRKPGPLGKRASER